MDNLGSMSLKSMKGDSYFKKIWLPHPRLPFPSQLPRCFSSHPVSTFGESAAFWYKTLHVSRLLVRMRPIEAVAFRNHAERF